MTNKTKQKDHELLAESLENPSVFALLVDRYEEPFMRKIISITHSKEDAQDIVQEAFVKMYLNAKKFQLRESAAFSSWCTDTSRKPRASS